MKLSNYCDFGHETSSAVRVLPLSGSENHGNVIVCRKHYVAEMKFRHDTHWESISGFDAFPAWETLKISNDD